MKISVITPTIRGLSALKMIEDSLKEQNFSDYEWLIKYDTIKEGRSDLNEAYNQLLRSAKGELVVFVQDYISMPKDGLQKFWEAYKRYPNTFFTAPVDFGKDDWRMHRKETEDCTFVEWEINWASAPLQALIDIGGFDEELDKYWGFDNVNIGLRADMAGYKIKNLQGNMATGWDHDTKMKHPYRHTRNPKFHNQRLDDIRRGAKVIFHTR